MRKSEGFHPPSPSQLALGATWDPSPFVHNTTGPVSASFPNPYTAAQSFGNYVDSFLNYFSPVGLVHNEDLCQGTTNGAARLAFTLIPGSNDTNQTNGLNNVRESSARAYVYPFATSNANGSEEGKEKDNLVILVEHQAIGIVWGNDTTDDAEESRAVGVQFVSTPMENGEIEGPVWEVNVEKEVIVASGAIGVCSRFPAVASERDGANAENDTS